MFKSQADDTQRQDFILMLSDIQFKHKIPSFLSGRPIDPASPMEETNNLQNMDILSLIENYYDVTSDHISQLFLEYDPDGLGYVDYDTLHQMLKATNIYINNLEFSEMLVRWLLLYYLQRNKIIELFQSINGSSILCMASYNKQKHEYEEPLQNPSTFFLSPPNPSKYYYIHVCVPDPLTMSRVSVRYSIHPLVIEDILGKEDRVKLERYREYLYLSLPTIWMEYMIKDGTKYETYHVSSTSTGILDYGLKKCLDLGLCPNIYTKNNETVITFRNNDSNSLWNKCESKLKHKYSKARNENGVYLVHAIMDIIVDQYIPILQQLQYAIKYLDTQVEGSSYKQVINQSMLLCKEIEFFQRRIRPLFDILESFSSLYPALPSLQLYIRDINDHLSIINHSLSQLYENSKSLRSLALSSQDKRMNKTVSLLTLVTTIFAPLSFLAGVYGMNFDNFPELRVENGYYYFWVECLVIIVILVAVIYVYYERL
ncbi:hypothetical protein WA158_007669 [Blastocystis sp. Blastoise]